MLESLKAAAHGPDPRAATQIVERALAELPGDDPFRHEIRGVAAIYLKRYAEAERHFEAMRDAMPGSPVPLFNLAEARFLGKRYEGAETVFADVEQMLAERDLPLAHLCRYRRVVCLVASGDLGRARILAGGLPGAESGKVPAGAFAEAVVAWGSGDRDGADAAWEAGVEAFGAPVAETFADPLIEIGWAKAGPNGALRFMGTHPKKRDHAR